MQITQKMIDDAKARERELWDQCKITEERNAPAVAAIKAANTKWHEAYQEMQLFEKMLAKQNEVEP